MKLRIDLVIPPLPEEEFDIDSCEECEICGERHPPDVECENSRLFRTGPIPALVKGQLGVEELKKKKRKIKKKGS